MNLLLRSPGPAVLLLLACCIAPAYGQTAPRAAAAGNPTAGAKLANAGSPQRSLPACTTCHGDRGQGSAGAGFPRLAGQAAGYLEHQLIAFTLEERPSTVMSPIARQLTAQQRRDLAAYFAQQDALALAAPPPQAGRGQTLALHGDEKAGVPACSSCHGWNGAGQPPHIPFLAGQHALYLERSLRDWREGRRRSDHRQQMPAIAQRLSDSDIEAVAQYFASLPPPRSTQHGDGGHH